MMTDDPRGMGMRYARGTPEGTSAADISGAGLNAFLLRVYTYMAGGLALTGLVAYEAAASGFYESIAGTPLFWLVLIAPIVFVVVLSFGLERMSAGTAQLLFWIYAAVMGLSLAGIFLVYTGASIARVFFITAATFGAMSLYGYTTRTDLTRFGAFLFMGLVGVLIASVVNLFVASDALHFAISVIGVIVFVGLTAYDTQRLKQLYLEVGGGERADRLAVLGALRLYLDFINLFVLILQLSGDRRNS
jgi:uncharacterized protein